MDIKGRQISREPTKQRFSLSSLFTIALPMNIRTSVILAALTGLVSAQTFTTSALCSVTQSQLPHLATADVSIEKVYLANDNTYSAELYVKMAYPNDTEYDSYNLQYMEFLDLWDPTLGNGQVVCTSVADCKPFDNGSTVVGSDIPVTSNMQINDLFLAADILITQGNDQWSEIRIFYIGCGPAAVEAYWGGAIYQVAPGATLVPVICEHCTTRTTTVTINPTSCITLTITETAGATSTSASGGIAPASISVSVPPSASQTETLSSTTYVMSSCSCVTSTVKVTPSTVESIAPNSVPLAASSSTSEAVAPASAPVESTSAAIQPASISVSQGLAVGAGDRIIKTGSLVLGMFGFLLGLF